MLKALIIIWIGSGTGGILRYLAQIAIAKFVQPTFPLGTLLVNIFGCFLIGVFFAMSERYHWMTAEWRWLLITGLCGGFTTFSSFSYENIALLRQGEYLYFALYISLSIGIGLLSTFLGTLTIK
ncbi:MAG: fluoride efflux transporter CrcB [Chryseobacterium sp.]|nr:fluoride efflux transporter CrcB [Chryseobacterium sp.]